MATAKNNKRPVSKIRTKSEMVAEHVEHVFEDLFEILDDESLSGFEKRLKIKSALFYWLGVVFDDANLNAQQLSRNIDEYRHQVESLKLSNDSLKQKLKEHLISNMEEL